MTVSKIDPTHLGLKDALDLAILIEEEAEERYSDFTTQMEVHGTPAAAKCFARMAAAERKHHDELLARRRARFGNAPVRINRSMLWDVEAPGFETAQMFMNSRRALNVALTSETKARAFFASLIPNAVDNETRQLFTELEDEERQHQELLKVQLAQLPAESDSSEPHLEDPPVAQ